MHILFHVNMCMHYIYLRTYSLSVKHCSFSVEIFPDRAVRRCRQVKPSGKQCLPCDGYPKEHVKENLMVFNTLAH